MARMTARKRARFLEVLAREANVSEAARASGLSRQYAYVLRRQDADFAADWDAALDEAVDALLAEAHRRALHGVEEPVFYKGRQVGTKRVYSDRLLTFLISVHRPAQARRAPPPPRPEPATLTAEDLGSELREEHWLNGKPIVYDQMLVLHPEADKYIDVGHLPADPALIGLWQEKAIETLRFYGALPG